MDEPPRHVLEEAGMEDVAEGGGPELAVQPRAGRRRGLGRARRSCARGARPRGLGGGAEARAASASCPGWSGPRSWARAPARGRSRFDGRPLVGRARAAMEGLWVAAGHGPWASRPGLATAPGRGRRAARAGRGAGAALGGALLAASTRRPRRIGPDDHRVGDLEELVSRRGRPASAWLADRLRALGLVDAVRCRALPPSSSKHVAAYPADAEPRRSPSSVDRCGSGLQLLARLRQPSRRCIP